MEKAKVTHKDFALSYNRGELPTDMTEYIEDMYNNANVRVLNMQIVYQRSKFSEDGFYRVIFVIRETTDLL